MKTLDRFLMLRFLRNFFFASSLLVGAAYFAKITEVLEDLSANNTKSVEILSYLLCLLPSIITLLLPFAYVFSLAYTIAEFAATNELLAIFAAGRSLLRVILPFFLASFIVGIAFFTFNDRITSEANYLAAIKLAELKHGSIEGRLKPRSNVAQKAQNRYYYFGNINIREATFRNLHLTYLNEKHRVTKQIEAESGFVAGNVWHLNRGRIVARDASKQIYTNSAFAKKEIILPETMDYFRLPARNIEEMNVKTIAAEVIATHERGESAVAFEFEYFSRFSQIAMFALLIVLPTFYASKANKGALAWAIMLSVGVAAGFYMLSFLSRSLAMNGLFPVGFAAWFSNISFAIFSCITLTRNTR